MNSRGLRGFIKGLVADYRVYGIVERDGIAQFKAIESADEPVLSTKPTHLSAKQYLFPPVEPLVRFSMEEDRAVPSYDAPWQVLLGLHPCDIRAIELLDMVFNRPPEDPYYLKRRRHTLIIGADCLPDEYCFCQSLGCMEVASGFDLFIHRLDRGCIVRVGTERGRRLLKEYGATRRASRKELSELERLQQKRKGMFVRTLRAEKSRLPAIYERGYNHPLWERIGAMCYGCGSCNHVCPTCYCFDIKDSLGLDLKESVRYRVWDGCTLEDFALVAGGHNFRKERAHRLRHRFNRKFLYPLRRFDSLFCVGCGRCIRACLVGIDITAVTNELADDAEA